MFPIILSMYLQPLDSSLPFCEITSWKEMTLLKEACCITLLNFFYSENVGYVKIYFRSNVSSKGFILSNGWIWQQIWQLQINQLHIQFWSSDEDKDRENDEFVRGY